MEVVVDDDEVVDVRHPFPEMTPSQFEEWVAKVLQEEGRAVDGLEVTLHDKVVTPDGSYDMDATVRFTAMGMEFLVFVEAKYHKNAIKRDLVQVLQQKVLSAGAHKGIIVSTAPFQQGALNFAAAHGIALVQVTEGQFLFLRKAADMPAASRAEARSFGIPDFVGLELSEGETPGAIGVRTRYFNSGDDRAGSLFGVPGLFED